MKKVLHINKYGMELVVYETTSNHNPYKIYKKEDGKRIKIEEYQDFNSVLYFIKDYYTF